MLERLLPVGALWIVCWPMAAIRAAYQLLFGATTIREFDRIPVSLRPCPDRFGWVAHLWIERTYMTLARLMYLWPDRLSRGRWKDRCRFVGLERVERNHTLGRPIILATLHFGPWSCLATGCARGLPAAGLRDRLSAARPLYLRYHRRAECSARTLGWTQRLRSDRAALGTRPSAGGADPGDDGGRPASPAYSPATGGPRVRHGHGPIPTLGSDRRHRHPLPDRGRPSHDASRSTSASRCRPTS